MGRRLIIQDVLEQGRHRLCPHMDFFDAFEFSRHGISMVQQHNRLNCAGVWHNFGQQLDARIVRLRIHNHGMRHASRA